ncbi:MAG: VWA domain-containing protein, partial [Anaerolineae bacterium]
AQADLAAACETTNPFVATARFAVPEDGSSPPAAPAGAPAVVALRDTPGDDIDAPITLATHGQVGAVFGLAYDASRGYLYAAAYHKAGAPHGPGGPGAIYRIDISAGIGTGGGSGGDAGTAAPDVSLLAQLDAGPDRHEWRRGEDEGAGEWVGISSIGGVAVNADGSLLAAVNQYQGRIDVLSLPDGASLGSFRHGGFDTSWRLSARPFAVAFANGWLYHGLVDDGGRSYDSGGEEEYAGPVAHVFRSRPDGSEMSHVLALPLVPVGTGPGGQDQGPGHLTWAYTVPMLADMALRPEGGLLLGLRNRQIDAQVDLAYRREGYLPGIGGAVVTLESRAGSLVRGEAWLGTELETTGGLARLPGLDIAIVPALARSYGSGVPGGNQGAGVPGDDEESWRTEMRWVDGPTHAVLRSEAVGRVVAPGIVHLAAGVGDVEVLCPDRLTFDPDLVATTTAEARLEATSTMQALSTQAAATATAVPPTLTAYATKHYRTATAAAATAQVAVPATATAAAQIRSSIVAGCESEDPWFAITVFARDAVTGRLSREPAIVAFDGTSLLNLTSQVDVGAVYGLAYDWRREHLYAAAYHKRSAILGPAGPGAIYRLDLKDGSVVPWLTTLAGPSIHDYTSAWDEVAAPWVGRVGFGDIEISEAGDELYVVNMFDRRVYRYGLPDGEPRGSFAHGASALDWSRRARPMALGVRGGAVFHGLVDEGEVRSPDTSAHVYRSLPDGSDMAEVVALEMTYGSSLNWPWRSWDTTSSSYGARQPMLADLTWNEAGDLLLGFRDRDGDAELFSTGYGDLLPARLAPGALDRWLEPITEPEFYHDDPLQDEATWGALAAHPFRDEVVSSAVDVSVFYSGGALWFRNSTGRIANKQTIYQSNSGQLTFGKSAGLGDIEVLCPPVSVPSSTPTVTSSPTASPTSTATPCPTPTPTATATSTSTATATATPVPEPIYLPFTENRLCRPELIHADVVLVLDMSTSMYRTTSSGRSKHEAAIDAAHAFVGEMDLAPDRRGRHDRVGVVGFNDTAWTAIGMTGDRAAVDAALDGLVDGIAQGTRLDLAIEEGQRVIDGAQIDWPVTPVLILLTDGLPNRVPTPAAGGSQEETVLAAAAAAKAAGTRVFTIGLGLPSDVLRDLLAGVASEPGDSYYAPDGEDLADIYREIAGRITACP